MAPWLKIRLQGDADLQRIMGAVDRLVYDDGIVREKVGGLLVQICSCIKYTCISLILI